MRVHRDSDELMIRAEGVRVDYADVTAVRDLDLRIGAGEVFGLIGPNGAGKSSLIRVLATLQEPTHGRVWIDGIDTAERAEDARRAIGYMPDLAPVYKDLRCWEFLDLFASAYGIGRRERASRIAACLDEVGISGKRDALAGTLSRGMTQRLVLAKTILPGPRVLLLDEPASGLDPIARVQMRRLLQRLAGEGRTVLISSHILTELSEFCTSVGIMQKGKLIASGAVGDVVSGLRKGVRLSVEFAGPVTDLGERLASFAGVSGVAAPDDLAAEFDFSGGRREASELLGALVRAGLPVCSFGERAYGMEDVMLELGAEETS